MANFIKTDTGDRVGIFVDQQHLEAFGAIRTSQFQPTTGWTFAYNINPGLIDTDTDGVTGGVTHSTNLAVLSTGTAADGYAQIQTKRGNRYIPGIGGMARFTATFTEGAAGSTQYIGQIDDTDGWAFGFIGDSFGILKRAAGADEWIRQESWNVNTRPDLDPTKGNVYQIEYRWLGFGAQIFSVEDMSANVEVVHIIHYANRNTATSIDNPNLPLTARVENTGNTTAVVLRTPSAIAGLDGDPENDAIGLSLATDVADAAIIGGTEKAILTLRNPETWLTKNNRMFLQALRLSLAAEGTKPVIVRVYANAAITGGAYADVATNVSPVQVNTTMTAFTGGTQIGTYSLAKDGNISIDLTGAKFKGYPGEEITITALSANASEVTAGIAFRQFL